MNDLKRELIAILIDPQRTSLYSVSQLVAILRERGVELPDERQAAWEVVSEMRAVIEMGREEVQL